MDEMPERVLVGYEVTLGRKNKRQMLAILKAHVEDPCGNPTMGILIIDGVEYPACADMLEAFRIDPEQRLSDQLEAWDEVVAGEAVEAGEVSDVDGYVRQSEGEGSS